MTDNVYRVPVLAKLPGKKEVQWFNDDLFLLNDGNSQENYFFDGVGVINGVLHSFYQKSDIKNLDFKRTKPFDIKGALTLYYRDKRISKIISDFFGSSFIYRYRSNGYLLYSSCLSSLINVLEKELGITLTKSLFFEACSNTLGNGAFNYSSYECINVLPENSMVLAVGSEIQEITKDINDFLFEKTLGYQECLSIVKMDILDNVKAILNSSFSEKLVHITGGKDSRLVVSAFDYLNSIDDIELNCLGKEGNSDFDNAVSIANILDGTISNRPNYSYYNHPKSLEDKYLWEQNILQGMLVNTPLHTGVEVDTNKLVISGGYGEFLRRFYDIDSDDFNINMLGNFYDNSGNKSSFLSDEILLSVQESIKLFFEYHNMMNIKVDDALELFYLKNRNRYFTGNIVKMSSKFSSRFDVLYSPYIAKLSYLCSTFERKINMPLFDVMKGFSKKLTEYPFGTTKWPDELIELKKINLKQFDNKLRASFQFLNFNQNTSDINWLPTISKEVRNEANKMKAAAWQVQIYPDLQKKCLDIIDNNDFDFRCFFEMKHIYKILKNKLNNRVDIRRVLNLYKTLLWLSR